MSKRTRQYLGLLSAVIAYYMVHEGAHLIYSLCIGTFKQIRFMGIGIQIVTYSERMSSMQLGIFCAVGAVSTALAAYALTLFARRICGSGSRVFRACMYYITLVMLLLDPLYLSVLCGLFGGGDMNGISLLVPELPARLFFGLLLIINSLLFWKVILPQYRRSFAEDGPAGGTK